MPKMSKLIRFSVLFLITILLLSCVDRNKIESTVNVAVTLPPYEYLTNQIAGNRVLIKTLLPPGANAHSFETSPQNMKDVVDSDIYFRVGDIFKFENVLLKNINESELDTIIDCSAGIEIIKKDPHIWLAPNHVKIISRNILDGLTTKLPQHKNYFRNNYNRLITKIDSVDFLISQLLEQKSQKSIFVYHSAWKYLLAHYNLTEVAFEQGGKSPNAKDFKEFFELAKQKGIKCIFFDPHFDIGPVLTIAQSLDIQIDSLNPLPDDYIKNLIDIKNKFEKYLK